MNVASWYTVLLPIHNNLDNTLILYAKVCDCLCLLPHHVLTAGPISMKFQMEVADTLD